MKPEMKIVLVHNYYPVPGGGEDSVVEEERRLLEENGHEVIPFFVQTHERGFYDLLHSAIALIWNPSAYRKVRKLLKHERPDIVHIHNTFPLLSPAIYWACKKEKVPVVQTLHNYRLICANGLFLRQQTVCEACTGKVPALPAIHHRCYRNSFPGTLLLVFMQWFHHRIGTWAKKVDRYIALTDFSRSRFVQGGFPPDKTVVKPNFIHPPPTSPPPLNQRKRQALFVGRFWPEKGVVLLVQAWLLAQKKSPELKNYQLFILGDGPQREAAEECIRHAEMKNPQIHFMGTCPREEVLKYLMESRFMLLPSIWYEGFPMTILEAFASATPVISANIGSMSSIITDEETGLFFNPGSIEQLADRIIWAIKNEEEMEIMGKNARKEYEEKYTPQTNLQQLMTIYAQAIQTAR